MLGHPKTPGQLARENEEGRKHLAYMFSEKNIPAEVIVERISHALEIGAKPRLAHETPAEFLRRVGYIRD